MCSWCLRPLWLYWCVKEWSLTVGYCCEFLNKDRRDFSRFFVRNIKNSSGEALGAHFRSFSCPVGIDAFRQMLCKIFRQLEALKQFVLKDRLVINTLSEGEWASVKGCWQSEEAVWFANMMCFYVSRQWLIYTWEEGLVVVYRVCCNC